MTTSLRPLIVLALAVLASATTAQKKPLTEQHVFGGERVLWYTPAQRVRWADDGLHYVMRKDGKAVRIDPQTGAAQPAAGDDDDAGGPEPGARRGRRLPRSAGARVVVRDGDLWLGAGEERVRLTDDGAPKRVPQLSPDAERVSFVRDDDLVILDVATKKEWAVTTDGGENILYGVLDWVYQEEVYGRGDFQGHWWSDDAAAVAFLRLDETDVKPFTVIQHVPPGALARERTVVAETTRYPKAGDPNPTAQLHVAWPATRQVVPIALEGYDPDVLIVRVGWRGDKLLFAVQDRIQTWLDLNVADPRTGEVTRMLRETSDTWVNRLPFPRWLPDGSFLWFSERTGYQHLYHYSADGELQRALTSGDWQVTGIEKIGELEGKTRIWFTATKDGAIDSNLYRVDLDGENLIRLTQGRGRHRTDLNQDGSWFLDTVSTVETPEEVRLCKGDGSAHEVLSRAQPRDVERYVFCPTELLTIPARDGYVLDATLIAPPDFDASKDYPIYLPTYSGPDHATVRNAFSPSTWHQFVAQQGCLVLQVNVRSASGRGQEHTGRAYKQLGVVELQDLEDAVDWVCANRGGDPQRVAIEGWSYGGFMAGYALTHSNKFALGLAGGGVFDWRLYDTIYTERYMQTPQQNPEGYAKTSVIEAAGNLHGHLVVMHGVMDDNVHVQNAMQLVHALQEADKDSFELMLYPTSRHGVRSGHRQRFMWRAMKDVLGLGAAR